MLGKALLNYVPNFIEIGSERKILETFKEYSFLGLLLLPHPSQLLNVATIETKTRIHYYFLSHIAVTARSAFFLPAKNLHSSQIQILHDIGPSTLAMFLNICFLKRK